MKSIKLIVQVLMFLVLKTSLGTIGPSDEVKEDIYEGLTNNSSEKPIIKSNNNNDSDQSSIKESNISIYEYKDLKDYQRFEELISAGNKCIGDAISMSNKGKKIFLVTGPTRAGKSTIINSLLGNNLEIREFFVEPKKSEEGNNIEKKNDEYDAFGPCSDVVREKAIFLKENDVICPSIGSSDVRSETLFPQAYTSNNADYVFIDTPGFFDNRGAVEQLFAVEFIKMCTTSLKIHSIIVVVSKNNLMTAGKIFRDTIENIGVVFYKIQEKTGIDQGELKKNSLLVINKIKNGYELQKAKDNIAILEKDIRDNFLRIKDFFSNEEDKNKLRYQNIFFDIFSEEGNNVFALDKGRVLYPSMQWIIKGQLKKLIWKITNKNSDFFIRIKDDYKSVLVGPGGAVAASLSKFSKRIDDFRVACKDFLDLLRLESDNIINKDIDDLVLSLKEKTSDEIKRNENKIEEYRKKNNRVVVLNHSYHFQIPWYRLPDISLNKLVDFESLGYYNFTIKPKEPIGAFRCECAYVRLKGHHLGILNHNSRDMDINFDYRHKVEEKKVFLENHSSQKFGFWAYPGRAEGSHFRIVGYCNYNQTKACKNLIESLEKENKLKSQRLNQKIKKYKIFDNNKKKFKDSFEKLLLKSTNSQEKEIAPYKLNYYLKKINEKANMLDRWSKFIYVEKKDQNAAKYLNLKTVQELKSMASFFAGKFVTK